MAYVISDKCTACGKCEAVCPVEAIAKGEKKYAINAETCVSCGQCVDECSSEAIAEV
ncbi:MAG: 4Fe-4S binding protein [Kiritimatiellaeota bacterium]|nr:4Fe-4S binding protein [Kiritimatiellota bacterium]